MFTSRGWSYSSESRPRKRRGAYRASRRGRGRFRLPAVSLVIALPLVVVLALAAFASAAPGVPFGAVEPAPTPLNAALKPLEAAATSPTTLPPALGTGAPTRASTAQTLAAAAATPGSTAAALAGTPPTLAGASATVASTPPTGATAAPTLGSTAAPTPGGTTAPTLGGTEAAALATLGMPTLVPTPQARSLTANAPLLPGRRIVAYYGNPLAKEMGILGELPSDQMLKQLQQQIAKYNTADPARPVVPALELVTPAAQGWPGEDGLYRARMKPEVIEQVAGWAEANHALLILDVQIGLSSVPEEVDALIPYLRRPYVHLALDPEFAIPSGHIPGEVVGTLDAAAIDGAIHTLSSLVAAEHLPPKVLIVHRFTDSMVTNAWAITKDPNVQVIVTMDGFGPPALKLAQYHSYVHDHGVQFGGIKLFYHHDVPLLSPPDVLALEPVPDLVIYQ